VPRKVVCISHATGAGGEEVGRLVAERLGFLYVDEDIVARAATKGGVEAADVADAERRRSLVERVLNALAQSGGEAVALGGGFVVGTGQELSSEEIGALLREAIEQTAARGNVVIVAHAASHAVSGSRSQLRALVTASPETRTPRVAEAEGLEPAQALRSVKDSDAGRADYLKRFYDVGEESPTQYDVVINTDVLSIDEVADLIVRAASR
jgi:cytidylate kinase